MDFGTRASVDRVAPKCRLPTFNPVRDAGKRTGNALHAGDEGGRVRTRNVHLATGQRSSSGVVPTCRRPACPRRPVRHRLACVSRVASFAANTFQRVNTAVRAECVPGAFLCSQARAYQRGKTSIEANKRRIMLFCWDIPSARPGRVVRRGRSDLADWPRGFRILQSVEPPPTLQGSHCSIRFDSPGAQQMALISIRRSSPPSIDLRAR